MWVFLLSSRIDSTGRDPTIPRSQGAVSTSGNVNAIGSSCSLRSRIDSPATRISARGAEDNRVPAIPAVPPPHGGRHVGRVTQNAAVMAPASMYSLNALTLPLRTVNTITNSDSNERPVFFALPL